MLELYFGLPNGGKTKWRPLEKELVKEQWLKFRTKYPYFNLGVGLRIVHVERYVCGLKSNEAERKIILYINC